MIWPCTLGYSRPRPEPVVVGRPRRNRAKIKAGRKAARRKG